MKVAIVGGSLVGPALALMLQSCGVEATVYEATPETVPQAGGIIGLDHQSLQVLEDLGIDQNEVIPFTSERVVSIKVRDRHEEGRVQTIYPGRNTTWTVMHKVLRSRLPEGTFQAGEKVTLVTEGRDGKARLHLQGHTETADLVVFADGRKSTGRRMFDPARQLSYAGYVAFRGLSDQPIAAETDWMSYRPSGTQFNGGPIRTALGGVGTDWTFYSPIGTQDYTDLFGVTPTQRTFILPHQVTPAVTGVMNDAAAQMLPPDLVRLVEDTKTRMVAPVVDIDEPDEAVWGVGDSRIVLVGDALAPVRPHTARGLNNGLSQVAGLTTVIKQHMRHSADLDAGLAGWWQRERPLVVDSIRLGPTMGEGIGLQ